MAASHKAIIYMACPNDFCEYGKIMLVLDNSEGDTVTYDAKPCSACSVVVDKVVMKGVK
jgi:hypothetical protein